MGRRGALTIAVVAALLALPASASARDAIVESFDGTPINTHFYPGDGVSAAKPAPTVLVGPGWSMSGDTQQQGAAGVGGAFGVTGIAVFLRDGYNVLTWDPRGFGGSGGTVQIDDPDYEGRDVQALIDFVAEQPEASSTTVESPTRGSAWPGRATAAGSSSSPPGWTTGSTPSPRRSPGTT